MHKEYRDFFKESQAGQAFIKKLEREIDAEHQKAEKATDPHESYAHTQRAMGIRTTLGIINSLTAGVKKGNNNGKHEGDTDTE